MMCLLGPSFIVLDPALCPRGLSVEMTVKVDPAATMYRAPRYILDSGASSFNSRGGGAVYDG